MANGFECRGIGGEKKVFNEASYRKANPSPKKVLFREGDTIGEGCEVGFKKGEDNEKEIRLIEGRKDSKGVRGQK